MRKLYTAADLVQAHVLRGALQAVGIVADVRGGFLDTSRGGTPVTSETAPTLWVADDADWDVAQEVVRELESGVAVARPIATWRCACGEVIEGQFSECWKCGESRPT